jgi:biopolymer transport protein ExbD
VFIKAPKDKQYGDIVAIIDVVKGAGAQPIGLQIDYLQ